MLKCKELSRLPKAPSAKYVNFRRQTPGCSADLLGGYINRYECMDPSHPAATVQKSQFPNFRSDALGVRAFPFAVLSKPEQFWPSPLKLSLETWTQRIKRSLKTSAELGFKEEEFTLVPMHLDNGKPNAIPMSVMNATSKKRTSKEKHIRGKIGSRLKVAINLIVSRGANVAEVNGKPTLVMDDKEAREMAEKWILPGWTYVLFPTLEIYRMPYYDMIPLLRASLRQVYDQAQEMEKKWASLEMKRHKKTLPHKNPPSTWIRFPVQSGGESFGKTTIPLERQSSSNKRTVQPGRQPSFVKPVPKAPLQRGLSKHPILRHYSTAAHSRSNDGPSVNHGRLPRRVSDRDSKNSNRRSSRFVEGNEPRWSSDRQLETMSSNSRIQPASKPSSYPFTTVVDKQSLFDEEEIVDFEPRRKRLIHLGGVAFKGPTPESSTRSEVRYIVPENKDVSPRVKFIEDERKEAAMWLGRSVKLLPERQVREQIKRRIGQREAQNREPLGPEFVGFSSHPNPSYDPFQDMESQPPLQGPRKALVDLIEKHSLSHAVETNYGTSQSTMSDSSAKGPHTKPSISQIFDPFAPLMKTKESSGNHSPASRSAEQASPELAHETSSSTELSNTSYDPLDLDQHGTSQFPFHFDNAPNTTSTLSKPIPSTFSLNPDATTEDLIQSFDPFSDDQNTAKQPSRPSKASTFKSDRLESAERLKRLNAELYGRRPILLPWRAFRRNRRAYR